MTETDIQGDRLIAVVALKGNIAALADLNYVNGRRIAATRGIVLRFAAEGGPLHKRLRRMLGTVVLGSCLATETLPGAVAAAQQPRPSVLFILADNLGYGDLGVHGGGELRGAPTPRIDELAAQGLRLTRRRNTLLTFVSPDLIAARWQQFRATSQGRSPADDDPDPGDPR